MDELVYLKRNDAFTNSLVIAEGTQNQHESVIRILTRYQGDFGKLEFTDFKSGKRGRPIKVCHLNEEQATLLMTYLGNNEVVRKFKKTLVHHFFEMRKFIVSKQSAEYLEARAAGKIIRREETDTIKELGEYAKEQGSNNPEKLYTVYSTLANSIAGVKKREQANVAQIATIAVAEKAISTIIKQDMSEGYHYKEIYKDAKNRIQPLKDISVLATKEVI